MSTASHIFSVDCRPGYGLCVVDDLIVTSCAEDMRLYVYSAVDGTEVAVCAQEGVGPGELFFYLGGLCATSRSTVLIAESENLRVQVRALDCPGMMVGA